MEFENPEYFVMIADTGSISKAAARLFMAQPSLSQYVHRLEKQLSTELFTREARGVKLTASGKIFYAYAQNVLRLNAQMRGEIASLTSDLIGEITVAAEVLSVPIARLYCSFKNQHPHVDANFIHMDGAAKPDLIITTNLMDSKTWDREQLLEEQLFIAVASHHPLAKRKSVCLQELSKERFIYSHNRENDKLITQYCKDAGFEPNVLMEYYSTYSITALVEEGLGITVLPAHRRAYLTDRIVLLPVTGVAFSRKIYLCRQTNRVKNPATEEFAEYILKNIQNIVDRYAD